MKALRSLRRLFSATLATALVLQLFAAVVPTGVARAAAPSLVLSEINWAGSAGTPTDQWVEVANMSGSIIDFATTPYRIEVESPLGCTVGSDCATVLTLDAATLGANSALNDGQFLVLGALDPASTAVDLPTMPVDPADTRYVEVSGLSLSVTAQRYFVVEGTLNSVVDMLGRVDGTGEVPYFGSAANGSMPEASMARSYDLLGEPLPGEEVTSWRTSMTRGVNLKAGILSYATPGTKNVEVAAPTGVVISPAFSTSLLSVPKLSGVIAPEVSDVRIGVRREVPTQVDLPEIIATLDAGLFSADLSLPAGRYSFTVMAFDVAGNAAQVVPVRSSANDVDGQYVIFQDSVSSVEAPVLTALPSVTAQPSVAVSGTVVTTPEPVTSVDVVRNGAFLMNIPVLAGQFSAEAFLTPNTVNTLAFVAVTDLADVSLPTLSVVVHDSLAPVAINIEKVSVIASKPGSNDMIAGLAGAAEAGTFVSVFSDAALTKLVSPTPVTVSGDGSFPPISIGDNLYGQVWLRLTDLAGNASPAVMVKNVISFTGSVAGIQLANATENQLVLTWQAVPGAHNYLVKYRTDSGEFGPAISLCNGLPCEPTVTLINLSAGTNYLVAVAPVDAFGNVGTYSEFAAATATPPAPVVFQEARRFPAPTPVPDPVVEEQVQEPEEGDVKSISDEARNWTPWIILSVLVGVAILAALGYFYWFGGEAGAAAVASATAAREKIEHDKRGKSTPQNSEGGGGNEATKKSEKRW